MDGLSVTPRVSLADPQPSSRLCLPFLDAKQTNLRAYSQVPKGRGKVHLKKRTHEEEGTSKMEKGSSEGRTDEPGNSEEWVRTPAGGSEQEASVERKEPLEKGRFSGEIRGF